VTATTSQRIVVLGAGIGGLTAAALLARAGHDVTVLEGNDWARGRRPANRLRPLSCYVPGGVG
jgi:phytoene desaturase